jgi:hypothetical protein
MYYIYTLRKMVEGESSQIPKDLDTMITILDGNSKALEPMLIVWA